MRSGRNLRLLFYDSCDIQNEKSKAGSNGRERDGGGEQGKREITLCMYIHTMTKIEDRFSQVFYRKYMYTHILKKRERFE